MAAAGEHSHLTQELSKTSIIFTSLLKKRGNEGEQRLSERVRVVVQDAGAVALQLQAGAVETVWESSCCSSIVIEDKEA